MTPQEKQILLREVQKYIKENCYLTDGSIKYYDLWLVGWVAAEFHNRRNAMRILISNEYGLMGNLLDKLAREPDPAVTRFIESSDREVLLQAIHGHSDSVIRRNGLDNDPYAMRLLIEHDTKYADRISGNLTGLPSFLLSIVHCCPEILKRSPPRILADDAFLFSLVAKNPACLKYLPHKYHSDYRLCMEAVRQNGFSLMYIDLEIRAHDEIVLTAVSSQGNALSFASPFQRQNRNIVQAAVSNCGLALDYADDSLKHDAQLVALAVSNRGMALRFAAPELQDHEEIVHAAVENDGYAIRFASDRLKDNFALGSIAISTYPDAYNYLSLRLRCNSEIIQLYARKKEEEENSKWLPSKMR